MKYLVIKYKQSEGKTFPYTDIGSEFHSRISFRLWISKKLEISFEKKDISYSRTPNIKNILTFPIKHAKITKTQKGTLILKQDPEYSVYNIYIEAEHRGKSCFKILSPTISNDDIFPYKIYHSQRGSLGVSSGALVNIKGSAPIKYQWQSGSKPDSISGVSVLASDGNVENFELLPDGLEAIEALC